MRSLQAAPNTAPEELPSYRMRYAQIVTVLAAAVALVALLALQYVNTLIEQSSREAERREQSIAFLNDGFSQLYRVRQQLHGFLLTPLESRQAELDIALLRLQSALLRFAEFADVGQDPDVAEVARNLHEDGRDLEEQIRKLVEIRHNPALWFPATALIEQELQSNSSLFIAEVDALSGLVKKRASVTEQPLLIALYELHKAWLRMVSEFRLMVADRFGAYTLDPQVGTQGRMLNIQRYADQVDALLAGPLVQRANQDIALVQAKLRVLRQHAAAWQGGYRKLVKMLQGEDWRTDLQLLRERIDPRLREIEQQLELLRVKMQAQRRAQINALTDLSIRLSRVVFAALGVMLMFGILAYLSLDRWILRPIRELAENLKASISHSDAAPSVPPAVRETHDLLNAFAAMQERVQMRERELDHLAHHDALTGLPNRAFFRRRLAEAIATAQRNAMPVGVLFMDLDRFKQVNDSYGHAAGDQMLVEISERLRKVFRQEDVIARLGGDEFAIILQNLHERTEMTWLAQKALGAIQRPYEFNGHVSYSGASIGIAVAPGDGTDPDRLIQLADTAMYAAKKEDGSSYRFVSPELTAHAAAQHALENELREAIRHQQLALHFQPVLSADGGDLHCYESLLRWPHAEQGMLKPAAFMNALADTGLYSTISDWALDRIQGERPSEHAVISINLSARLLHDGAFAQRLLKRIDSGRLVADELILEITEDTLETDLRVAARVLHELKRRGVRIALDDFGTGQASLSHLRRFPFDYIKIDQSFVAGIGQVPNDEKLIQAIIRLAHALGMRVVAEGVETDQQREFLIAEACDYIQGYLIGKPAASG